jgi:hypothetical protein
VSADTQVSVNPLFCHFELWISHYALSVFKSPPGLSILCKPIPRTVTITYYCHSFYKFASLKRIVAAVEDLLNAEKMGIFLHKRHKEWL